MEDSRGQGDGDEQEEFLELCDKVKQMTEEKARKRKHEAAQFCEIDFDKLSLPSDTKEEYLRDLVQTLNIDHSVHGVIVQLPLPPHMDEVRVCNSVDPSKDVDGFTQTNLGRLVQGLDDRSLIPCTALAVKKIIQEIGIRQRWNQEHKSHIKLSLIQINSMIVFIVHVSSPPSVLWVRMLLSLAGLTMLASLSTSCCQLTPARAGSS